MYLGILQALRFNLLSSNTCVHDRSCPPCLCWLTWRSIAILQQCFGWVINGSGRGKDEDNDKEGLEVR
jgi:hypothetical protein